MGKGAKGNPALTQRKAAGKANGVKHFTIDEVKKHRLPDDAWMVYRSKVYDVSSWHEHPGGDVIFTHAGDDFTDIFNAFHPKSAFNEMDKFYIGELDVKNSSEGFQGPLKTTKQEEFEEGYRRLRVQLQREGMYDTSQLYYLKKNLTQLAIWSLGMYFAYTSATGSFLNLMVSGFFFALFFQQSGWLAHDYCHHQVYDNRLYNNLVGFIHGNLAQGFSVAWWKNKHNSHHSVPNLHSSVPGAQDGDPDIDTMPMLAWSMTMAQHAANSKLGRFMVLNQKITYFPLLCVARISWLAQSFMHVFDSLIADSAKTWGDSKTHFVQFPKSEMVFLVLHYVWYFTAMYFAFSGHGVVGALVWTLLNNCLCGLFLALVFGLGHNGMATYDADKRPDFWKLQVTTTRNITSNPLVDWFCGGLQYQVDHHLFPSIPRHNLAAVHKRVVQFCEEQGVQYHEAGFWQGTKEVLDHLGEVTEEFIEHFPAM